MAKVRGGDEAGSEPTPYQVHVGWSGPTQSTFNVNWRTDGEGTTFARILYGTSESAVAGADDDTAEGVSMQNGHTLVYETATTNLIELDGRVTLLRAASGPEKEVAATAKSMSALDPGRRSATPNERAVL